MTLLHTANRIICPLCVDTQLYMGKQTGEADDRRESYRPYQHFLKPKIYDDSIFQSKL